MVISKELFRRLQTLPVFGPEENIILTPSFCTIMKVIVFFSFHPAFNAPDQPSSALSRLPMTTIQAFFFGRLLLFIWRAGEKNKKKEEKSSLACVLSTLFFHPCDEACPWDLADKDWCCSVGLMASFYLQSL